MTIKRLTQELIDAIVADGTDDKLFWDGGDTSLKHVQYMESLGVALVAGLLEYLTDETVPEKLDEESTAAQPNIDSTGRRYFFEFNKFYYTDLIFDGGGAKGSVSDYVVRYDGMIIDHNTGIILKDGARLEYFKASKQDTSASRFIEICQADFNGANIEILDTVEFNEFGNRYAETTNPIYIEAGKRLFYRITGGLISNPQIRLAYREVKA